jgi:hypothetical protein
MTNWAFRPLLKERSTLTGCSHGAGASSRTYSGDAYCPPNSVDMRERSSGRESPYRAAASLVVAF